MVRKRSSPLAWPIIHDELCRTQRAIALKKYPVVGAHWCQLNVEPL
ncbi:hypothetical protein H1Q63_15350 [Desmonostoc muscorum CCALA 125]|nr:hypothetical protein [Desmonostoc muscorum CCALA 125]